MSFLPIYHRLTGYLSICLIFLQPIVNANVSSEGLSLPQTMENSEIAQTSGTFQNGLSYTLVSGHLDKGALIKISCATPPDFNQTALSELTQQTFFYGTVLRDREEICEVLNQLSLDIDADTHLKRNEGEISVEFVLEDGGIEEVQKLLELACEMVLFPVLEKEQVELAREHLLNNQSFCEEDVVAIQTFTQEEVQEFYQKNYIAQNLHLLLVSRKEVTPLLATLSDQLQLGGYVPALPSQENSDFISSFEESIDWSSTDRAFLIDGKICMDEPNWINRAANGRTLGAVLTALGIGGIIIALPVFAPLVVVGGLSTATGFYLMFCEYMKDPYYIENVRREDLVKGCAHAYRNHRAGITLTPYERRFLFINEIVNGSPYLNQQPILLVADLYRLNDPILAELFTAEELIPLIEIKGQFIQHRNQFKKEREILEQDLANATAPFEHYRNEALDRALNDYDYNSFVVAKRKLESERKEFMSALEEAYQKQKITLKDKESSKEEANKFYEERLSHPDFVNGLAEAERSYKEQKQGINANYSIQVELCKQIINYDERLRTNQDGVRGITYYYNLQLVRMLSEFPSSDISLPDQLDLRAR
jgi:hypothetical protein